MEIKLRDYQEDISTQAAKLLNEFKIAYLAMETRTGKTFTAFATCQKYGVKKILFVTKKKAISSIEKDALHFTDLAVTVINYESVLKKSDNYDLIILDESHGLGAYPKPAKRVKDLIEICRNKPIIYLSATPAPESHSQFYHQFYLSSFSSWRNYANFYKWSYHYVAKKVKYLYNREVPDYSEANKEKIKQDIDKYFVKITQKEAGFDVTIEEKILTVPMNMLQINMIERLKRDRIVTGQSGSEIIADTAVKLQNKIHQISSGTVIDENNKGIILSKNKAIYIKDYFKGQKIAVYYKFKQEFEVLKSIFDNWTDCPDSFQKGENLAFFSQFVSGREGIRLDTADAIIFYNIDFSYLSYAQAKDRIVSKERTKQAILYWIFSEGGIEQKIYEVVKNKQDYTNFIFRKEYGIKNTSKNKKAIRA